MKNKDIRISAQYLTKKAIQLDIVVAKHNGYDTLTYTWEPIMGPYLTIDLKDFNDKGV